MARAVRAMRSSYNCWPDSYPIHKFASRWIEEPCTSSVHPLHGHPLICAPCKKSGRSCDRPPMNSLNGTESEFRRSRRSGLLGLFSAEWFADLGPRQAGRGCWRRHGRTGRRGDGSRRGSGRNSGRSGHRRVCFGIHDVLSDNESVSPQRRTCALPLASRVPSRSAALQTIVL